MRSYMKIVSNLLFISYLVLFTATCAGTTYVRNAGPLMINGDPYHWAPSAFPIPVAVSENLRPDIRLATEHSIERWNREVGLDVFYLQEMPSSFVMFDGIPIYGYVSVTTAQLGITDQGFIKRGVAELNNMRTMFGRRTGRLHSVNITIDIDYMRPLLLDAVVTHELGHSLGLAHDQDDGSIMFWSAAPGQYIQKEDFEYVRQQVHGPY